MTEPQARASSEPDLIAPEGSLGAVSDEGSTQALLMPPVQLRGDRRWLHPVIVCAGEEGHGEDDLLMLEKTGEGECRERMEVAHSSMSWSHPAVSNWHGVEGGRVVTNSPWRVVDPRAITHVSEKSEFITMPAKAVVA